MDNKAKVPWGHLGISRRKLLKTGAIGAGALAGASVLGQAMRAQEAAPGSDHSNHNHQGASHSDTEAQAQSNHQGASHSDTEAQAHGEHRSLLVGTVDHERNGFDPMQILVDWDYGKVSSLPNGQTLREYTIY